MASRQARVPERGEPGRHLSQTHRCGDGGSECGVAPEEPAAAEGEKRAAEAQSLKSRQTWGC